MFFSIPSHSLQSECLDNKTLAGVQLFSSPQEGHLYTTLLLKPVNSTISISLLNSLFSLSLKSNVQFFLFLQY